MLTDDIYIIRLWKHDAFQLQTFSIMENWSIRLDKYEIFNFNNSIFVRRYFFFNAGVNRSLMQTIDFRCTGFIIKNQWKCFFNNGSESPDCVESYVCCVKQEIRVPMIAVRLVIHLRILNFLVKIYHFLFWIIQESNKLL